MTSASFLGIWSLPISPYLFPNMLASLSQKWTSGTLSRIEMAIHGNIFALPTHLPLFLHSIGLWLHRTHVLAILS